jgi:hypothetical protein
MSRALNLTMGQDDVIARCAKEKVGISAIERIPSGGTRLVCMSGHDAERLRTKLKSHIIKGDVVRERHRPTRPLW